MDVGVKHGVKSSQCGEGKVFSVWTGGEEVKMNEVEGTRGQVSRLTGREVAFPLLPLSAAATEKVSPVLITNFCGFLRSPAAWEPVQG
ncbi:hypothetical protein E5D57_005168 [Metarhizium anisopliae]|nr:hypothetical protein E5D57_005168 [Metarhizium anisopliae]